MLKKSNIALPSTPDGVTWLPPGTESDIVTGQTRLLQHPQRMALSEQLKEDMNEYKHL